MLDTGFHITYTKQCISSKELFVNVKQEKKEVSLQHCNLPGQVGTGCQTREKGSLSSTLQLTRTGWDRVALTYSYTFIHGHSTTNIISQRGS